MAIFISTDIRKPLDFELVTICIHKEAYAEIYAIWEILHERKIPCDALGVTLDSIDNQTNISSGRVLRKNDMFIWLFENGTEYINNFIASNFGISNEIGALGYESLEETTKVNIQLSCQAIFDINSTVREMKKLGFRDEGRVISKVKVILWIMERGRKAFNEYPLFLENKFHIRPSIYK